MRRAAIVILLLLAACGDEEKTPGGEKVDVHIDGLDGDLYRVEIDGMPCVIWKDKHGEGHGSWAYSGLTCDWRDR